MVYKSKCTEARFQKHRNSVLASPKINEGLKTYFRNLSYAKYVATQCGSRKKKAKRTKKPYFPRKCRTKTGLIGKRSKKGGSCYRKKK